MISLSQRPGLLAALLLLSVVTPAGTVAYARGGGFSGGLHGGASAGALQSHPAGMPPSTSHALPAAASTSPLARAQPGPMQTDHRGQRHHRPPTGSGSGSGSSGTGVSSATDSSIGQSMSAPMQTQVPSPPANTGRDPALTGGTDPAIGQPIPPIPDTIASSGGSAVVDHSGGGGNTLAACMGFWDRSTHMSRGEWRQTCTRTLNGVDLPVELGGTPAPVAHRTVTHAVRRGARHVPTSAVAQRLH